MTRPSALEVFINDMRYINPRFTYLLTYLPSDPVALIVSGVINKPTTDDLWISPVYRRLAVEFSKFTM